MKKILRLLAALPRIAKKVADFVLRRPLGRVALALVLLLGSGVVLFAWLRSDEQDRCDIPVELRLLASAEIANVVEPLVSDFAEGQAIKDCRALNVTVKSVRPSRLASEALADGWSRVAARPPSPGEMEARPREGSEKDEGSEERVYEDVGMRPDAIILPSTPEWRYVDHSLLSNVGKVKPGTVIARSPLVVAAPERWVNELPLLRDAGDEVALADLLEAATATPEAGGFGLMRPHPDSSADGLLATAALYRAALGALPEGRGFDERITEQEPVLRERVEQKVQTRGEGADELLCELEAAARPSSRGARVPRGLALVPEQAVVAYQSREGDRCEPGSPAKMRFLYLSDVVPELDYQYVAVDFAAVEGRPWGGKAGGTYVDRRVEYVEKLRGFLIRPDIQKKIADGGFRDRNGQVSDRLGVDSGVRRDLPSKTSRFDVHAEIRKPWALLDLVEKLARPTRVALAVDVSGSMRQRVATGGTRLEAARAAVRPALALIGKKDELALLSFADDPSTVVELGTAGSGRGGGTRRAVNDRLGELAARGERTALFRAIVAGVREVRRPVADATRTTNAVVVLTDGQDEDQGRTVGVEGVVAELNRSGGQVQVFVLTYGDAACGQGGLHALAKEAGVTCFDPASPGGVDAAFDGVAASLWGVDPD
jgi:Ca-activated chloride channel family protein